MMKRSTALLLAPALACVSAPVARPDPLAPPAPRTSPVPVRPAVEVFIEHPPAGVLGKRVGLITNQSGIDRQRRSTIDLLRAVPGLTLVALYSPEHGIRGVAETRVASSIDAQTGLPVYSLYGDTDKPTPQMLQGVDVLVYDIQDLGVRQYTFESTLALAMQAAAERGIPIVVLDRPNPVTGTILEGNILEPAYQSFVGIYPVLSRHGMTLGELAKLYNAEQRIGADLTVVPVEGWRRDMWWDQTGLPWVNPSPNIRRLEAAIHYPGTVFFEATNVSEGRGTDLPFEQVGAPWLKHAEVAAAMNAMHLPGIRFEAVEFPTAPTARKYPGEMLKGVRFVLTDRDAYRPLATSLRMIELIRRLHPDQFRWACATDLLPLSATRRGGLGVWCTLERHGGTARLRQAIEAGTLPELLREWEHDQATFQKKRAPYLIYGPSADTVWLENRGIRFGFDASNGSLLALTDHATGEAFAGARQGGTDTWRLDRLDPVGPADSGVVPSSARSFSWRRLAGEQPGLALVWSDFELAEAPALRVTVDVRLLGDSAMSQWRIAVDSPGTIAIAQVRFPRVAGIPPRAGEELAVPRWMGALARDAAALLAGPDGKPRRLEWTYPGTLSLQLLALYRRSGTGGGLYAAADDTLAYRKTFAVWGEPDGSRGYELVHPLENPASPRTRWTPAYAALLGTFHGDWITAAERYREWGTRQGWARDSRLRRGLVPDWLLRTGMWVWNRGRSPGVVPPALALQRALALPVAIHWHWWHHGPYDTSFPDYLPPREGVDSFRAAVAAAHAAGSHAMVYMNQRLWCTGTPSWRSEGAARWAVKEKDGRVRQEVYNAFDPQPCATMDVTTSFWRAKYTGLADTVLSDYGVDGIYMDQAVQSLVCWDPTHGHPVGGGNYWMGGFRALAAQIRAAAERRVLLAGEGAGEPWLPELDLMLTLQVSQERYSEPGGWEPIPFFQAVYHAYGVTYGSYSSLVMPPYDELWPAEFAPPEPLKLLDTRFRRQFFLEQARSFVWGLEPTIANFRASQLTDRPEETAYMMRLARIRVRALDYLLYGTWLRPPELKVPLIDVDLSRVSIYAAQRGGPRVSTMQFPAAIAGAWRAADGSVGIAVASIVDQPTVVSFDFDPRAYGFSGGGQIERTDEAGRRPFGRFSSRVVPVTLELPAGGAYVLEFRGRRS